MAHSRRPAPPPLEANDRQVTVVGTMAWAVALAVTLVLRGQIPAGDRWWAVGGAVYMLQAIKRVRGMRLITPAWLEKSAREKALIAAAKRERHDATKPAAHHLRIVK